MKLYLKRNDGSVSIKEITPTMFSSTDSYNEALEYLYSKGYCDTYEEAMS